jgi:hypothetical protein
VLFDKRKKQQSKESIMLMHDDIAFLKAISKMQVSPALLKEQRRALASRSEKKRTAVAVGKRRNATGGSSIASQRMTQLKGKRKVNELASSGDSSDPPKRPSAPGAGSSPLHATSPRAMVEQGDTGG